MLMLKRYKCAYDMYAEIDVDLPGGMEFLVRNQVEELCLYSWLE